MEKRKKIYTIRIGVRLLIAVSLFSLGCERQESENLFGGSPNERVKAARSALYAELQAAEYGWKFVYFPRVIDGASSTVQYTYLFDFMDDNQVQMEASNHGATRDTSEYDVALGSTVKLRFITYNFIHELADAANSNLYGTGGRSAAGDFEFLYYGKDGDDLIFRTNRNATEIRLEKAAAENWGGNKEPLRDSLMTYFRHRDYHLQAYQEAELVSDSLVRIDFDQRQLALFAVSESDTTQTARSGLGYGVNGVVVMPAIEIDGKEFYFFKWNQPERKLEAVVGDLKVEIEGV